MISLARMTKNTMYQNIGIAFSVSMFMMLLSAVGLIPALAGAFLHNIGAFIILINSSQILRRARKPREEIDQAIRQEEENEAEEAAQALAEKEAAPEEEAKQ